MIDEICSFISQGTLPKEERAECKSFVASLRQDQEKYQRFVDDCFSTAEYAIAGGGSASDVLKVLSSIMKMDQEQEASNANQIAFSPGPQCKEIILSCIKSASKSLDIAVFTISDNEISNEIIAARKKGVKVRVLTDNDKACDEGSDIGMIAEAGIPIKVDNTSNHMHHKFAIIDNHSLITGSYNWTKSAEKFNQENVVVIAEKEVIKAFQKEYNNLWDKLSEF